MATPPLKLGAKFSTWDEVFHALEEYSKATQQTYIKHSTRLCSTLNRSLREGQPRYPEHMKYAQRTFRCCHGGIFTAKGHGIRKKLSQKIGCKAKINVTLNRSTTLLEVIKMNEYHCHGPIPSGSDVHQERKFYPQASAMEEKPTFLPNTNQPPHGIIHSTSDSNYLPFMSTSSDFNNASSPSTSHVSSSSQPQDLANLSTVFSTNNEMSSGVNSSINEAVSLLISNSKCFCQCTSHSPCPNMGSFLSFFQRKDDEDRKLREQDIDLRTRECILREKEVELQRQQFELDKQERKSLLDLLGDQFKSIEQRQRHHDVNHDISTSYNHGAVNNSVPTDNHMI